MHNTFVSMQILKMSNVNSEIVTVSPTEYADKLGLQYTNSVSLIHKKNAGQYFTPVEIARFLANFAKVKGDKLKLLDPGCGTGILSCAIAEFIIVQFPRVKEIELTAFETDLNVIPLAEKSFLYLRQWLLLKNVSFNHFLCANDFILHNSSLLANEETVEERFHLIVANPPYFKIPKNDPRAVAAKAIIHGQTNIYSIFLIISAKLLAESGQLIFITPRSFASGSYFRLFREIFFSLVKFNNIHLFNSRRDAFLRDNILQENVIIDAEKKTISKTSKKLSNQSKSNIIISTSNGISDLGTRKKKSFFFHELVNVDSQQKILHLPLSISDEKAIKIFKSWTGTLNSYNIDISTGPVVDFRSLEFINSEKNNQNNVPLIWLNNIRSMEFIWPLIEKPKGKEKGQYIKSTCDSRSRLIANKNYVFLRRFSSKDDLSRLTASHYFKRWLPEYKVIGVENHLNYIYRHGGELKRAEVLGIAGLLNSKLFDIYFRTFNGNINVSATELRVMPFPSLSQIESIGHLLDKTHINKTIIDSIVESIFKISLNN